MSRRRTKRKRVETGESKTESTSEIAESFDKLISTRKKQSQQRVPLQTTRINKRVPFFLVVFVVLVSSIVIIIASLPQINPEGGEIVQSRTDILYKFALEQPAVLESIFCYCYCEMGSLRGCFYSDNGDRETHAENCEICLAEAEDAKQLSEAGWSNAKISAYIDQKYG